MGYRDKGVSKNSGTPKMDGENNGKPNFSMDDLGENPTIFGNIHIASNLEISRHWSQEFDFFEFCSALSALKPWGGCGCLSLKKKTGLIGMTYPLLLGASSLT